MSDTVDKVLLGIGVAQSLAMTIVEITDIVQKEEFTQDDLDLIFEKQQLAFDEAMDRLAQAIDNAE